MKKPTITWAIEDHLCRACGGRILRSVSGAGVTPGGNPLFKCASCGQAQSAMAPDILCWCGFHHRMNHNAAPYRCVPFADAQGRPKMLDALRACGTDPARGGEVGVALERDWRAAMEDTP